MTAFPYRLSGDDRDMPRLGVIVLQVDETIEQDFRRLFAPESAKIHVTRIPSGAELTPDTIAEMAGNLTQAASLLPEAEFDVIAYACTSGTTLIGADKVAELVKVGRKTPHVTNPLTAAVKAIRHVGANSVAIVSPYIPAVSTPIRKAFIAAGFDVPMSISFGERVESSVARIDPDSIRQAALKAVTDSDPDCIFLSCTNLRTLDIIEDLEAETGRPVLSSNMVLAWHMASLAGLGGVSAKARLLG